MTLYELLTLQRPLSGKTHNELLYQIGMVEPRSPRSIDKSIPPELETILAKATTKEAAERYASARAMADDLQRFLSDKPILAARRRSGTAPPSGRAAINLWRSPRSSCWFSPPPVRRQHAPDRPRAGPHPAGRMNAADQNQRSGNQLRQARQAVNFFTEMAESELPKDPRYSTIRRRLLEAALNYYQAFIDERKDDPSITQELEAAHAGRSRS